MNWTLFLITLAPLIIFVIVDLKAGARTGVYAAMIAGVVFLLICWAYTGEFDTLGLIEVLLIIGLGFLSLRLNNSRFFKFQPGIVGVLIALYLLIMQIFVEPLLIRMLPMMKAMQPEMADIYESPQMIALLGATSAVLIPVFLLHALLMFYVAIKCSNKVWIGCRILIYPLVIIALLATALFRNKFLLQ